MQYWFVSSYTVSNSSSLRIIPITSSPLFVKCLTTVTTELPPNNSEFKEMPIFYELFFMPPCLLVSVGTLGRLNFWYL
jgi:hypothetical protein